MDLFPKEVVNKIGYYVYRLIDPRNGETFYVGKGKGNRVFEHAAGVEAGSEEFGSEKLERIRKIKLAGFDVQHVIHRHGMDERVAFEVEGAVMDAYPGLTNISGGHGNEDRGVAHAREIVESYQALPVEIRHPLVEITINRSSARDDVYNATRYAWKMARNQAEKAEIVLAVVGGIVVEVFVPNVWLDATKENFEDLNPDNDLEGRIGFRGKVAKDDIRNLYIRKKMPPRKKGAANPIRYFFD